MLRRIERLEAAAARPEAVPVRAVFWLPVKDVNPGQEPCSSHLCAGVYPFIGAPGVVTVHYESGRPELLPSPYREQQIKWEQQDREDREARKRREATP